MGMLLEPLFVEGRASMKPPGVQTPTVDAVVFHGGAVFPAGSVATNAGVDAGVDELLHAAVISAHIK